MRQRRQNTNYVDAPSAKEREREHKEYLSANGCKVCDESDPDNLESEMRYFPNCSAMQSPKVGDPAVVCTEHAGDTKQRYRNKQYEKAARDGCVAVAWYDCGRAHFAEPEQYSDDPDDDNFAHPQDPERRQGPPVPVRCECGDRIEKIVYLDELMDE